MLHLEASIRERTHAIRGAEVGGGDLGAVDVHAAAAWIHPDKQILALDGRECPLVLQGTDKEIARHHVVGEHLQAAAVLKTGPSTKSEASIRGFD